MSRIKVLEVIRQGQIGGGESHLLDLAYFLDKDKFEPVGLSFTSGEMVDRLERMGIKCHVIPTQKAFDWHVQQQIIDFLRREQIQIVHAHGSRAASNMLWPARKLKLPFVYTVHGWSFHDDQSWAVKTARAWSEKLICRFASRVVCVSKNNAETGRRVFGLQQADVIENGINLERFNPDGQFNNLRAAFGFADNDFVAGFIARCTKQKSPVDFLEAVRLAHQQHEQVRGLFVGEGDLDAEVDSYIARHQMGDYVFRSKFRTDVPDLLHCIDAYCLPSLWEGLSIALLEAMAMRKAIIATPTDGTKELLTDGQNGLVIPFGQPQQLADAICRLHNHHELLVRCGEQAHEMVARRFNAKRVAESVEKIYVELYQ
ncbi:MAG: glycosyltransferase [Prevotella sp.]|nr:glycosyltransferase [Prevotella sp.]